MFGGQKLGLVFWMLLLAWCVPGYCRAPVLFPDSTNRWNASLANRLMAKVLAPSENRFWVNGQFNPYCVYRKLHTGYSGTYGGLENLSFAPYPNLLSPTVNTLQPTLLLSFGGLLHDGIRFGVDYAYFYNYDADKTSKHAISGQNNLVFSIDFKKAWADLHLMAGGGAMPIHFSPLTLSNRYQREGLFDRVPWEYHRSSSEKYERHFYSSLYDSKGFDKTGAQGIYLEASRLPLHFSAKAFYGRTQLNLFPDAVLAGRPSEIGMLRVANQLTQQKQVGVNLYLNQAWADNRQQFHDQRFVATTDFSIRTQKGQLHTELGLAALRNPMAGQTTGFGFMARYEKKTTAIPFGIQLFAISRNYVCLENEVFNSNTLYRQGGFGGDSTYDNLQYPAYLNPAGTLANNRIGLDLSAEKKWNAFSVAVGHQSSRALDGGDSIISFGHRVNAYSRSRFAPWQQYTGPYRRVGNRFRMSIERLAITHNASAPKFFHTSFLDAKYAVPMGRRRLIFCSYTTIGNLGTSALPYFGKAAFLHTAYEELEIFVPLGRWFTAVGLASWEWNKATANTQLSATNQRPLNQYGTGYGIGLDVDFGDNASLNLRHRWLHHADTNFEADAFSGQETVVEIKISF